MALESLGARTSKDVLTLTNANLRSIRLKPKQRRQLMKVIEQAKEREEEEEAVLEEVEQEQAEEAEEEAIEEAAVAAEALRESDPATQALRDKVRGWVGGAFGGACECIRAELALVANGRAWVIGVLVCWLVGCWRLPG